jgi:short subunit dehydrogenase-like uncharacterized protein
MILVYGAYGFTGKLIVQEIVSQNLPVILSGRDQVKLKALADQFRLPYNACLLDDDSELDKLLNSVDLVINCAGPFKFTADKMARACLRNQCHYIDITGEYQIFERLQMLNANAVNSGIMVMPGTGFDVVPSDCLALKLKRNLPDATSLVLCFASTGGGWSGGTMKTMLEDAGNGGRIRMNGSLKKVKNAYKVQEFNFGTFQHLAVTIPWGDLSSAYFTTGIPNIETYMAASPKIIKSLKKLNTWGWLMKIGLIKKIAQNKVEKSRHHFEKKTLNNAPTFFYGKVINDKGETYEARLKTINGYLLTAKSSVLIAKKILNRDFKIGYQTPASAYGFSLIEKISGSQYF